MTAEVIKLYPCQHVAETLRLIADEIDSGQFVVPDTGCTIVLGWDVFQAGSINAREGAQHAVFNMTSGISRITHAINKVRDATLNDE